MVKEHSIMIRSQAVGMLQAGSSQKFVSMKLGVNIRTIQPTLVAIIQEFIIRKPGGPWT